MADSLDWRNSMDRPWLILESGAARAEENMALDEALLESSTHRGCPVIRFYSWCAPAASFGYSQKYAEVAEWTDLRPLVRRPTGGGLVLHTTDWTYSVVFPREHTWYRLRASESYARMHRWFQPVFAGIGVMPRLAEGFAEGLAGQCFARSEEYDLVLGGKKIAGAAQRRSRTGLLIQGSVQLGALNVDRGRWEESVRTALVRGGQSDLQALELDSDLVGRVGVLMERKYLRQSYHRRR